MALTPIITVEQADSYNAQSAEWLALSNEMKEVHIFNASLYMQSMWTCADVIWTDSSTIDDDLLRACAYYADASRVGVLYTAVAVNEKHRSLIMHKRKMEGMEETFQWGQGGAIVTGNPLESIHALMKLHCTANVSGIELVRV